jgi:hypothetical protein
MSITIQRHEKTVEEKPDWLFYLNPEAIAAFS